MQPTILIAESSGFSADAAEHLQQCGHVLLRDLKDRASLLSAVHEANVLWVRLRHRIDAEVMGAAPHLRAIATPTTGLNHIDLREAQRREIEVISLSGATDFLRNVHASAEHTIALIFALLRHIATAHQHVISGGWNRDLFLGRELYGKTAGVIGFGRIGQMVATYLLAFGMQVLVTDIDFHRQPLPAGIESVPLRQLLETSDIVSLHISLTDLTRGFLGQDELALLKRGAWFINTSRGELVDERALLDALRTGRLAGAALDVLVEERASGMSRNLLVQYARSHENVLITPHIGGCTHESRAKTEDFLARSLVEFLRAQNTRNKAVRQAYEYS